MSTTAKLELQTTETAKLTYGDQEIELPVVEGSEGERAIDISRLRASTGLITLDEGFVNTGSTSSNRHRQGHRGDERQHSQEWYAGKQLLPPSHGPMRCHYANVHSPSPGWRWR